MAYQNVATPRFYINIPEWLHNNKSITIDPKLMTLPVLATPDSHGEDIDVTGLMDGEQNFIAMLNCPSISTFAIDGATLIDIVNKDGEYSGFRIAKFTDSIETLDVDGLGGSIIMGTYYDMPNAPNLSLTISREYSKIKEFTTYNGGSISNAMWDKPPKWGNLGSWELFKESPPFILGDLNQDGGINVLDLVGLMNLILANDYNVIVDMNEDTILNVLDMVLLINLILDPIEEPTIVPQALSRSSRRTWDLKFSYIDDSDLFGSNQMLSQHFDISSNAGYGIDDSYLAEFQIPVETLTNSDFEGDFIEVQSDDFVAEDWWYAGFYSRSVWTEETSNVYSGSKAQKVTTIEAPSSGGSFGIQRHSDHYLALDSGVTYTLKFKIYSNTDKEVTIILQRLGGGSQPEWWEDNEWGNFQYKFDPTQNEWYAFEGIIRTLDDGASNSEYFFSISQRMNIAETGDSMIFDKFELTTTSMVSLFRENLLTDDNFFSQVWHKTLGGTLPFIFQPDNTNNNPDQFAIAKINPNSLKATQSAFNVYDISLKIEEAW